MVTLHVLFFAALKEQAGVARIDLVLPDMLSVAELKARIAALYPSAAPLLGHALVSINHDYAFDDDSIPENAEVAFFPPVSGGGNEEPFPTYFSITCEPLDLDDLVSKITLPATGAACVFTGMVRGVTRRDDPHETIYLEYEAYAPMAEIKMAQVADEIRARWPSVQGISIVQRIGRLGPGTPTVLIACTASHRDTGVFEAARYGIDRLKEIVPVWKKEIGPNGDEWIEGDYRPKRGD